MKTLYETLVELGLQEPDAIVVAPARLEGAVALTGRAFSTAVLASSEFRDYIVVGLTEKTLPPAIILRLMDHGWGKPLERVEHTGPHGRPIETIKIVRVVVDPQVTGDEMPAELQKEIFH